MALYCFSFTRVYLSFVYSYIVRDKVFYVSYLYVLVIHNRYNLHEHGRVSVIKMRTSFMRTFHKVIIKVCLFKLQYNTFPCSIVHSSELHFEGGTNNIVDIALVRWAFRSR